MTYDVVNGRQFDISIDGDLARLTPPDVDESERGARLSPLYFAEE